MSILSGNNKDKKGAKGAAKGTNAAGAKAQVKPGKAVGFAKKPVKTGGTRGS